MPTDPDTLPGFGGAQPVTTLPGFGGAQPITTRRPILPGFGSSQAAARVQAQRDAAREQQLEAQRRQYELAQRLVRFYGSRTLNPAIKPLMNVPRRESSTMYNVIQPTAAERARAAESQRLTGLAGGVMPDRVNAAWAGRYQGLANYTYMQDLNRRQAEEAWAQRMTALAGFWQGTYPVTVASPAEELPAPTSYAGPARYGGYWGGGGYGGGGEPAREPSWVQQLATWRGVLA